MTSQQIQNEAVLVVGGGDTAADFLGFLHSVPSATIHYASRAVNSGHKLATPKPEQVQLYNDTEA